MTDIHAVIAELKALEAKATRGELTQDDDGILWCPEGLYGAFSTDQDTEYHFASRNALPQLLAYIDRLEAVASAAQDASKDYLDYIGNYHWGLVDALDALDALERDE